MRVTDKLIFDRATRNGAEARTKLDRAVVETSSGRRLHHPEDDPASAGLLVAHRLTSARLASIADTTSRATDELTVVDSALDTIGNVISRARELAVAMSNDTHSASDRSVVAAEVKSLFQQALGAFNTRLGDRYLFAGFRDNTPPFDPAGNYLGDSGVRQVEIAPGSLQDVSMRGDVIAKGAGGGVDILTTLSTLQTSLQANDVTAVRASLDDLSTGIEQISVGRGQTGAALGVLQGASEAARAAGLGETLAISHLEDADIFDATSRLALAQRALDAALTASARSFEITLLSKLR